MRIETAMTLPVTLADTPALSRSAETGPAATVSVPGEGGTAFAETLAGAMGPVAEGEAAAAVPSEAAEAAAPDTEAMLADLAQRAVPVEGKAGPLLPGLVPEGAVPGDPAAAGVPVAAVAGAAVAGDAMPVDALPDEGTPGDAPVDGEAGEETPPETGAEEEVLIELPLAALLAAALPAAPAAGESVPVQAQDAAVEAAQRAMAASMALPGIVKLEKGAKAPTDGPDAPDPMGAAEAMATEDEAEAQPSKGTAEARPAAMPMTPVAAEGRTGGEARREAVAEITLAAAGTETVETASSTGTSTATAMAGATAAATLVPGGPIQTGRPGWEAALADRIAAELSSDGKEIELDLAPETLGHLKIKLEVVDGLAQVRIVTETPEAARLFQQAEHRLSESLSRAGLSLGGQDTMSRDAQTGQGQSGQGQSAPGQTGQGPGDRGGRLRGMEMHLDRQGIGALAEQAGRAARGLVNLIA